MFRFSYFSWIRSVLFSFMSGSGLSDLWPHFFVLCPAPVFRIYDPFEFRFVCFVSRSKVKKFDDQACPFFVHVRSFGSMTSPPPMNCIFWPFLSCFTSSCVVSVRISVRLFCVPSTCIVSCIWLSFTLQSFFYLLSCPASVFLSWLCISSCLLLYKRHLFCWIGTKTKFTSLRQYHFICTVL